MGLSFPSFVRHRKKRYATLLRQLLEYMYAHTERHAASNKQQASNSI